MNGRTADGKFAPGNKCSLGVSHGKTGRPKDAIEAKYLKVFRECVTEEDWRAIIGTVVTNAKQGKLGYIRFLASYLQGNPIMHVEMDLDIDNDLTVRYDNALRRAYGEDVETGEDNG